MSTTDSQVAGSPALTAIPLAKVEQLRSIDGGRLLKRFYHVRDNCVFIPPAEIYLLVNPMEVYTTAAAYFARAAERFEKLRNILILFPLLWTWFGLSVATAAYTSTLTAQPKLIEQPFLKLWADGFPIVKTLPFGPLTLPANVIHFLSFGTVASIDVVIFLSLIFLTFIAQQTESHAQQKAHELSNWLQEELFALERQSMTIRSQGSERDLALDRVSALMAEMQKVVASFNTSVQQQADGLAELIKGTMRIATAADQLNIIFGRGQEVYDKLDATLPHLAQQFDKMAAKQDEAANALTSIADGINRAALAVEELARPFAQAGLARVAREVSEQQKQALNSFGQILQKQDALSDKMRDVSSYMSSVKLPTQRTGWFRSIFSARDDATNKLKKKGKERV